MEKDHFYFREINEKQGRWGLLWQNCSQVASWNEKEQLCIYIIILTECLSREARVAKRISNCCASSLIKTSISTKTRLLRLSPLQRFKPHLPSAVKIQNFFIKMQFLPRRRTHRAASSCVFQTIAVSLPRPCQEHILRVSHLPGFLCRTEEGRRASWRGWQRQSQVLTTLWNVIKQEWAGGILQTWCCSCSSVSAALLNWLKFATNTDGNFGSNKGFIEKRLALNLAINFSLNLFSADRTDSPKPLFPWSRKEFLWLWCRQTPCRFSWTTALVPGIRACQPHGTAERQLVRASLPLQRPGTAEWSGGSSLSGNPERGFLPGKTACYSVKQKDVSFCQKVPEIQIIKLLSVLSK